MSDLACFCGVGTLLEHEPAEDGSSLWGCTVCSASFDGAYEDVAAEVEGLAADADVAGAEGAEAAGPEFVEEDDDDDDDLDDGMTSEAEREWDDDYEGGGDEEFVTW